MHRVFKLLAFLLLAAWWPATLHCQIEAALELHSPTCESGCDGANETVDPCHQDSCATTEDSAYVAGSPLLKLAPRASSPEVAELLLAVVRTPPVDGPAVTSGRVEPGDWLIGWQFTRRAAAPPRAPAPFSA